MRNRVVVCGGALCVAALFVAGCGGGSAAEPTAAIKQIEAPRASNGVWGSGRGAAPARPLRIEANTPPSVGLRTVPAAIDGTVYGLLPLDVSVNLCQSSDADPGDSLRFDVDWGDGVRTGPDKPGAGTTLGEGGGPDGCDGRDCCRHRHRYERGGRFTLEASVSDKHLEDQSQGVGALAISKATVRVAAGTLAPPCVSIREGFESVPGPFLLLGNPLSTGGLTFRTGSDFATSGGIPIPGLLIFSSRALINLTPLDQSIEVSLPSPHFSYAAAMGSNWPDPDEYIVDGYLGGAKVFSDVFGAPVGLAGTAEASIAGGRRSFDRIVFSARNGIQIGLDDLDFTCE